MATGMPPRIGSYEITREIGRGGMGVVYLARDARLDRAVAIKALPDDFADDPARLARFEREAKTLAQLNHPNVAGIHGVEEQDGRKYLVLEYVEGVTLAERLDRGPLPPDEALEIGIQVAAGVEAAHDAGVIHRDLKPDNIKITPGGVVKVLDFGLARASEPAPSANQAQVPTLTTPASPTIPGAIMGTAPYMSPEQARGRQVDKRTDIWSFGVVMYECLTGQSPFAGETVSDSIGAILHKDLDMDRLPAGAPPLLRHVLGRCLQRDLSKRLRDIGDARLELAAVAAGEGTGLTRAAHATGSRRWRTVAIVAIVAAVAAGAVTGLAVKRSMQPEPPRVTRLTLPQPQDRPWRGWDIASSQTFGISTDGQRIAYCGLLSGADRPESVLVIWQRDRTEPITLTGLGRAVYEPFFSPDGRWIGYATESDLMKVTVTGGAPRSICTLPADVRGAYWAPDETIVFGTSDSGLYTVPAAGGTAALRTTPAQGELAHSWPDGVPGSNAVVFTIHHTNYDADLAVWSPGDSQPRLLREGARFARCLAPGYLVYTSGRELWADTFDLQTLALGDDPVVLDERVDVAVWSSKADFAIGQDGTLVYKPRRVVPPNRTLVWVNRDGSEHATGFGAGPYLHIALSPSGSQVAIQMEASQPEVWIGDTTTGRKVLHTAGEGSQPVWSTDGSQIIFSSAHKGRAIRQAADLSGPPEYLELGGFVVAASPDGENVVVHTQGETTGWDLWLAPLQEGETLPLVVEPGAQIECTFSPDGKWLAYGSYNDGMRETFIVPYPATAGPKRKVPGNGSFPIWSRDGSELFFRQDDTLMTAPITTEPDLAIGDAKVIYTNLNVNSGTQDFYGPMPDGKRFLVIKEDPAFQTPRPELYVVINWIEVLKAKLNR